MPRCEQCTKFVPIEVLGEVGLINLEETVLEAELILKKCCEECGNELEEWVEQLDYDLDEYHQDCKKEDLSEYELVEEPYELDIDSRGLGRGRGRKTFYIGSAEVVVKCDCGWQGSVEVRTEAQASHFDPLY